MNIFGIPICISYASWTSFVAINFSTLTLTDDTLFMSFLLINFIYIYCVIHFIKMCKYFITFTLGYIKKRKVADS